MGEGQSPDLLVIKNFKTLKSSAEKWENGVECKNIQILGIWEGGDIPHVARDIC